jgi:hypothetical protein
MWDDSNSWIIREQRMTNPNRPPSEATQEEDNKLLQKFIASEPQRRKLTYEEIAYVNRFVRENALSIIPQATGIARFQSRLTLLPDGRPLIVVKGKSNKNGLHFPLVRGSQFGAFVKLFIQSKGEPRLAVLIPETPEFEALRQNRLVLAFVRMGKVEEVFEYDYTLTEHAQLMARVLEETLKTDKAIKMDPTCVPDHELLRAAASDTDLCKQYFTREDWLQVGWIKEVCTRFRNTIAYIRDLTDEPTKALEDEQLKEHPRLVRMAEILSQDKLPGARLIELVRYFADPEIAVEGFMDIWCYSQIYSERQPMEIMGTLSQAWQDVALLPEISDWGRKQYIFSGFEKTVSSRVIECSQYPIDKDEDAQEYWTQQAVEITFDEDKYLDAGDMPANWRELHEIWKLNPPDIDPEEADEISLRLLDEASAIRQWTIPPRARVELAFGPFVAAELTELGDEVYFVWRTHSNRYWRNSVGVEKKGFANIAPATEDKRVAVMMKLVMCALVRDFLVTEDRRKIFDVTRRRIDVGKTKSPDARVVYLPRIRYIIDNKAPGRVKEGLEQRGRARHFVRAFFRKVEKPSPVQLEVARVERVNVPEGHTFVRAHYRGGGEAQKVYRSRSALQLLYGAVDRAPIKPEQDDWFGFERMTAQLLENHLGFKVLSRASKGAGGIDILATKDANGLTEIWFVECKCYGANNPIGPDKIRELAGRMAAVKKEEGQVFRGMFVTSSRYTPDALRTAVQLGIQTIDHDALVDICSAVNRSARLN